MLRADLVARASSQELSAWMALFMVQAEEDEYRRHVIDSRDGQVVISGRDDEDEED